MSRLDAIRNPGTLRARFFWYLVPMFLALFLLVGGINVQLQRTMADEEFRHRGANLASSLAYGSELGVLAEDDELLASTIRSFASGDEVDYVAIYGAQGELLAHGGRSEEVPALAQADRERLLSDEAPFGEERRVGRTLEFFAPVVTETVASPDAMLLGMGDMGGEGGSSQIGFVRVGLSIDVVTKQTTRLIRLWAGLAALFLVLAVGAIFVFAHRITGPVKQLTERSRHIAQGDLDQSIPIDSRDEIGQLATTFNEMAGSLKRSVSENERVLAELKHLNESLEDRIRSRTAELEELYRLSSAMQEPLSLRDALAQVLEGARVLVKLDRLYVLALSRDGEHLTPLSVAGVPESEIENLEGLEIKVEETGDISRVLQRGEALLYDGVHPEPVRLDLEHLGTELDKAPESRFVLLPLRARGSAIGVLACDNTRTRRPIGPNMIEMLQTFAAHAASAIENAQLFAELDDRGREIEAANRHKSEFLANMSHELRTPLNAVIGFSEVLLERMFGELNDKQAEYLDDILGSGRHLLSLINDILDLSKIEAGQMALDVTTFDLPGALANAETLVKERAQRRGITLTTRIGPELETFVADERKFKQVLLNLLTNAVKFTQQGGSVTLSAERQGSSVRFSVADTGIGISPDDQGRIFEAFRQAEVDYVRKAEGTGLGLTLSRQIVELHGGRIWVESEVGRGSTFSFILPIRELASAKPDQKPLVQEQPLVHEKPSVQEKPLVLVVENDGASANLLRIHLIDAGYRVELAGDGEKGLERARSLHPAAIVLDILIPKLDGWEFLSRIKADPQLESIPVIVVSMLDERGKGMALGATEHLIKPFDPPAMLETIRRVLALGKAQSDATVLAIDDDRKALELIRATLEPQGFRVLPAQSGEDGIERARSEHPDLIVLDIMMPGMDGFEVSRRLKEDPETAAIPIVVLTSQTLSDVEKRRLAGRISHLSRKSEFDRNEFVGLLRAALERGNA